MIKKLVLLLLIFGLAGCVHTPRVLTPEEIQQRKDFLAKIDYLPHDNLVKDLKDIRANNYTKGSLETTQEFMNRKIAGFKRHLHRGYKVNVKVSNPDNDQNNIVRYDPDKSILFITMPRREKDLVRLGAQKQLVWVHYSFLKLETVSRNIDSYVASNALGMKKEIAKIEEDANGIAILNAVGDYSSLPQTFTVKMDRNMAAEILKKGKLELNVFVDLQYIDTENENILYKSGTAMKPTMSDPYDVNIKLYGIPVRLVSMRLYDEKNNRIAEWEGQQIFASSISN